MVPLPSRRVRFLRRFFTMAFIPKDAKWYLAWLVEEITVGDDAQNIVHTNLILVRAGSQTRHMKEPLNSGKNQKSRMRIPDGKSVGLCFPWD